MENFEEKAYQVFGVHVGETVKLIKPVENGRKIKRYKARVVQFHPGIRWVRVEHINTGQSECFNPVAFMEAMGKRAYNQGEE